jgi:hypothetical protein
MLKNKLNGRAPLSLGRPRSASWWGTQIFLKIYALLNFAMTKVSSFFDDSAVTAPGSHLSRWPSDVLLFLLPQALNLVLLNPSHFLNLRLHVRLRNQCPPTLLKIRLSRS